MITCRQCGAPVLPVDPGFTVVETAQMLRITPAYVRILASHLRADAVSAGRRARAPR